MANKAIPGQTYDHVEVTREQPVLEDAAIRDINALTLVCNDDDSPAQGDVTTEVHISSDGQVVKFQNLGDLLESLLELLDLLKVVTELDNGSGLEHAQGVDHELAMLQGVDVTLDEQEIGTALDWQESASRNVDTVSILKVLDGGTSSSLELDDGLAVVVDLGVDNNIQLHALGLHHTLES